jgi:hypothetical protein
MAKTLRALLMATGYLPTHHSDVSGKHRLLSALRHSLVLKKMLLNCSLAKVAAGARESKCKPGACRAKTSNRIT